MKNRILELDVENRSNKIFGIGMPKTGTSSLREALEILGYRSVHSPFQYVFAQCLGIPMYRWEEVVSVDFKNEELLKKIPFIGVAKKDLKINEWDAIVNFGEHIYPILDKNFHNSKFILTVRDKSMWLKSIYHLFGPWKNETISLIRKMHIFQCINYDEDYLSILYDNHFRNVLYYFKDRKQDLLIIDICSGEGWEKLCPFLNKYIPNVPFPHRNKTEC